MRTQLTHFFRSPTPPGTKPGPGGVMPHMPQNVAAARPQPGRNRAAGPRDTSHSQGHDAPVDIQGNHLPPHNDPASNGQKPRMSMGDKVQVASNVAMGASMIAPMVQPLFQKKPDAGQQGPNGKIKNPDGEGKPLGEQADGARDQLKLDVVKQAPVNF